MRKLRIAIGFFIVFNALTFAGYGQQRVAYTQYMFNALAINPAYAGSDKYLNVTAQGRQQWIAFKGAPNSQMISAHMPLENKKVGVGMLLERQTEGVTDIYNAYAMYAYKIKLKRKKTLSLGLQAGITTYRERLTDLTLPAGSADPTFSANTSYTLPNFGVGVYYAGPDFYVGLSVPTVAQNTIKRNDPATLKEARHYFLMAGYIFDLNPSLKLKPNFLIKSVDGAPVNVDMNLNLLIDKIVWVGCSYRIGNAVNPLIELQVNPKFRVGFSYDIPISNLTKSHFSSGSPEIMINYRFVKVRPNTVVSPRYF